MLRQARLLKVICLCVIVFDCWLHCVLHSCVCFRNYRCSYLSFSRCLYGWTVSRRPESPSAALTLIGQAVACPPKQRGFALLGGIIFLYEKIQLWALVAFSEHLTSNGQCIQNINTNAPRWSNGSQRSLESPDYLPTNLGSNPWPSGFVPVSPCPFL